MPGELIAGSRRRDVHFGQAGCLKAKTRREMNPASCKRQLYNNYFSVVFLWAISRSQNEVVWEKYSQRANVVSGLCVVLLVRAVAQWKCFRKPTPQ